jgi:hypothetical protein
MRGRQDDAVTQEHRVEGITRDPASQGPPRVTRSSGADVFGLHLDREAHLARIRHLQMLFRPDLNAQRAAGTILYSCGTGADSGRLFLQRPDGRRFEYRLRDDGSEEIIREVPLVTR